ncbi:MAG: glutamate--tRNA ligase, partial [Candidatus Komeilibacteria bacterium CG_4_9_14_3_um_filter_37_5]
MKSQPIITRFAPSPTGYMHIGGLRTALYNYALAKKTNGQFILRIEDTDRQRLVADSIIDIINTLNSFHLHYDQGPITKDDHTLSEIGNNGPYLQSARLTIYQKYGQKLIAQGNAYYCFCDSDRLSQLHEQQTKEKKPTKYDGFCRHLTPATVADNLNKKKSYVIRLAVPADQKIEVLDEIRGQLIFDSNLIDDQILIKSDGYPTYHLAVIVDDHLMGVNHIIRGEEWLPSTPKHVLLYKYLDWPLPKYIHLPLLINRDRSKLSKRSGDVAVCDYLAKGYLPEAIINFIALLGWHPGQDLEKMTLDQIIQLFSIKQINKAAAIFDVEKLDWFNQYYLQQLSLSNFSQSLRTWLSQNHPEFLVNFNESQAQVA